MSIVTLTMHLKTHCLLGVIFNTFYFLMPGNCRSQWVNIIFFFFFAVAGLATVDGDESINGTYMGSIVNGVGGMFFVFYVLYIYVL